MENATDEKVEPNEKVHEDSSFVFDDAQRPQLIRIEDGKVNVSVLKMTMSKKHRAVITIDLWLIAWVSAMTAFMATIDGLSAYRWIVITLGCLSSLLAIGKTISDLSNWIYTMNVMIEQMGDWYIDDVVAICQDFIGAGVKFAEQEVKRAIGDKPETEASDGKGEPPNP